MLKRYIFRRNDYLVTANQTSRVNHITHIIQTMIKIILSLLITVIVIFPVTNALSQSVVNEKGLDIKEWDECGDKAISKARENMTKNGTILSNNDVDAAFAIAGYAKWDVIFENCGGKPTDGSLTNEIKDFLNKECADNKDNAVNLLIAGDLYPYSDKSMLIKNAEQFCTIVYNQNKLSATSLESKWSYRSSEDQMTGKNIKFAEVPSENIVEFGFPYTGKQVGKLIIRNHPSHGLEVIFLIGKGQILCNSYSGCNIQIRFDNKKTENWKAIGPADNSNKMLFFENKKKFLNKLASSKVIRIQVPFFQQGEPVFEFHVGGLNMDMVNKR